LVRKPEKKKKKKKERKKKRSEKNDAAGKDEMETIQERTEGKKDTRVAGTSFRNDSDRGQ